MKSKKLLLFILVVILVVALIIGLYFHFYGATRLDRPVSLVPPSADLYLEIASFEGADVALREISEAAGHPVSLPILLRQDQGAMGKALADPAAAGFDTNRPIGLAMSMRFGVDPLAVAFLPIDDLKALAAVLGIAAGDLRSGKATAFPGGWIGHADGYVLVANDTATIDDLLALEERGLEGASPEPGAVLTLWLTPNLFETARLLLEGFPMPEGKAALFAREVAGMVVGSIEHASIGLLWSEDGLRLRTRWRLDAANPLTPALAAGADASDLLTLLPPGALVSGFRIDPDAGRRLARAVLERTQAFFEDTAVLAMMEQSLDLVSRDAATSILSWGDGTSHSVRSVSIQSIPKGREADFAAFQRYFQRQGALLWESMIRGEKDWKARISFKDLPTVREGDLEIAASEMRTQLEIEPIPGADAATREALDRLRDQRVIQRFAVLEREEAESLFIAAAGEDPATIRDQIALIRGDGVSAANETAARQVMAMLGDAPVAFMIADPLRTDDAAPPRSAAFGLSARAEGTVLVVEAVWPRAHLAALPAVRFPVPFGAPTTPHHH